MQMNTEILSSLAVPILTAVHAPTFQIPLAL